MHSEDSKNKQIPFFVATIFVVLLAFVPMPLLWLIPVLAFFTLAIQTQLFHTRMLARTFWITTYLRSDSFIRKWIIGTSFLRYVAIAIAIPLSFVTYIAIYGYDLWDCIAVAVGISTARLIHKIVSRPLDANIAEHLAELAHLRVQYWLAIFAVLLSLAIAQIAKGLFIDYSNATSDELATLTIQSVKHPVRVVQYIVRTLRYSEYQILRVRDIVGWPYGWMIYFFFLIPNAVPAFGLVTFYAGITRVFSRWR